MSIEIPVSVGEFLDKLSILEVKSERIKDEDKLNNVRRELELLRKRWAESRFADADIAGHYARLKAINEKLWDIEDRIREKEARGEFDEDFTQLARSVYRTNDERAAVKRAINLELNSGLVEEKSYADYGQQAGG